MEKGGGKRKIMHSHNLCVCFGEERSNFTLFLVGILDIVGYDHTETENGLEGLKMLAKQNTLICKLDKR